MRSWLRGTAPPDGVVPAGELGSDSLGQDAGEALPPDPRPPPPAAPAGPRFGCMPRRRPEPAPAWVQPRGRATNAATISSPSSRKGFAPSLIFCSCFDITAPPFLKARAPGSARVVADHTNGRVGDAVPGVAPAGRPQRGSGGSPMAAGGGGGAPPPGGGVGG